MLKSFLLTLFVSFLIEKISSFSPHYHQDFSVTSTTLRMGFFDNVKFLFSEEGKEAAREKKRVEEEEQLRLQQEIYERRNNPEKMEEYEKAKVDRRLKYKNQKREWEVREEKVGKDGVWIEDEQ